MGTDRIPRMYQVIHSPSIQQADDAKVGVGAIVRTKRVGILKRLMEALPDTRRAAMGRKLTLSGERKNKYYYWLFYQPASLLGKSKLMMKIIRGIDYLITPKGRFYHLLDKYRPESVFCTDVQNEHDVALAGDARRRGIRVIGMVRSWDNLVTRALRFVPEKLIVHNQVLKDQARSLYGIRSDSVSVIGIPHYDAYIRRQITNGGEFLQSLGLDPSRKSILFFPLCDYRMAHSAVKNEIFTDELVLRELSKLDVNVIVRFLPNETVTLRNFVKPKNFYYDIPGSYAQKDVEITVREITPGGDQMLVKELDSADVVVTGPSTAIIDAAFFGKPIVCVNFGSRGTKDEIYEYKSEHIVNVVNTGGLRIANSAASLSAEVARYLGDGFLEGVGRREIVKIQACLMDGKACERLANEILYASS